MRGIKIFGIIFILSFFYAPQSINSQTSNSGLLDLDGVVYGYNYNPTTKGLFKKEKQITLEGTLHDVQLVVYDGFQTVLKTKTNIKGEFKFKIRLGKIYKLELTKSNHTECNLLIDLRNIPPNLTTNGIVFDAIELILNSYQNKDTLNQKLPFGKIYYNAKENFIDFEEILPKSKKGYELRKKENVTPVNFIKKSVAKNKGTIAVQMEAKKPIASIKTTNTTTVETTDTLSLPIQKETTSIIKYEPRALNFDKITEDDISKKESEISEIRNQLAIDKRNATTHEDSLAFQEKERILEAATIELNNAKKLITLQKEEIKAKNTALKWTWISILLLLAFLGIVIKYYLDKKKANHILKEKNRKITESINYAKRIQHAILLSDDEIKKLLPDSFIYFQPLNIVSGDFYWISKYENKIIVAAIDCTGHGVPGAFMSLICNSILNEIIVDKKVMNPSEILSRLNKGIIHVLKQDEDESSSMDGMELSLCIIDKSTGTIEFAGAMNPGFIVKNGKVEVLEADTQTIGGMNYILDKTKDAEFTTTQLKLEKGMSLYLLSDGFTDQFGGPDNKKFNNKRFKQLLLDIQHLSLVEQKNAIDQAFLDWKGNLEQIDDVLIIGMKF